MAAEIETPVKPVKPVMPVSPVRPVNPVKPVYPVKPVKPVRPVSPLRLVYPVRPAVKAICQYGFKVGLIDVMLRASETGIAALPKACQGHFGCSKSEEAVTCEACVSHQSFVSCQACIHKTFSAQL